jgi:hypothetical protein
LPSPVSGCCGSSSDKDPPLCLRWPSGLILGSEIRVNCALLCALWRSGRSGGKQGGPPGAMTALRGGREPP